MAKVTVMKSSVKFVNDNGELLLSKKHLPLVSGVISACSDTKSGKLASIGVARSSSFTSLAVPLGYKSRNELVEIAKDTCDFAVGKGVLVKDGITYAVNPASSELAEAVVQYVNDSDEFTTVKIDNKSKSVKVKDGKKSNDLKKFRVDDAGKLVRLGRGKPSPFWTIVYAAEGSDGKKVNDSMKVHQTAADPAVRKAASTSRKAANAQAIQQVSEVNTKLVEMVKALTTKVDNLTEMVEKLSAKQPTKSKARKSAKAKVKSPETVADAVKQAEPEVSETVEVSESSTTDDADAIFTTLA